MTTEAWADRRERLLTLLHRGGWVNNPSGCLQRSLGPDLRITELDAELLRTSWQSCEWREEHESLADSILAALADDLA